LQATVRLINHPYEIVLVLFSDLESGALCASFDSKLSMCVQCYNGDFMFFPLTRHRVALYSDGVVTPEVSHARSSPPWAACVLLNLVCVLSYFCWSALVASGFDCCAVIFGLRG